MAARGRGWAYRAIAACSPLPWLPRVTEAAGLSLPPLGHQCRQRNRLFEVVNRNRRVRVVACRVRICDLTKQVVALDDVQADALVMRGENAENHVVSGNHGPQRERLVLGHLDEGADL